MNISKLIFQRGFPECDRTKVVVLYDEAFGQKFSVAVHSEQQRLSLLEACFIPEYAIVAMAEQELVGIAGFHTSQGKFTGGIIYRDLLSQLGFFKGNWAAFIFSLYERKPVPGELLLDGIAVHSDFRSQGIGGKLLDEIAQYAAENKYHQVRLDVIDINPRAKQLYERKGFKAIKTEKFAYLKWLLGFSSVTTMLLKINSTQS